ncbi:MAG TPA: hypothetical protein VHR66_08050 [Gemmataceae bacterium]|nr:hypothetical protein [Gemmataceae bacterium]
MAIGWGMLVSPETVGQIVDPETGVSIGCGSVLSRPGFGAAMDNSDCFAGALNDCSPEISGEHYTSNLILRRVSRGKPSVLVKNLPFQPPETLQHFGISSLVANVLCREHNSRLSGFDTEGGKLFAALDDIDQQVSTGGAGDSAYEVNGDMVERWLLKTLIGSLFSGNLRLPDGRAKSVRPPDEYLDMLFRTGEFPAGCGLYLTAARPNQVLKGSPTVFTMEAEPSAEGNVIGLHVGMFGFDFFLALVPVPDPRPKHLADATYRPTGLLFVTNTGRKEIRFQWKAGSGQVVGVRHVGTDHATREELGIPDNPKRRR